ncbi:hypothetical protein SynWH8101_2493 [Synechococcus sp. WH 8101]|uniref:ELWxxDGT repeat protein n=1 Tax=Synechococcus sp. WH 8101 TaxID=59932 RepID=UPI001022DF9F|nr:ELWxxDGT repeat protein [Synechococcus sp. WH 8101]QBE70065.1 hypothetical protein SynWH8101_2493 [Synechococcus sp. WH 8101]
MEPTWNTRTPKRIKNQDNRLIALTQASQVSNVIQLVDNDDNSIVNTGEHTAVNGSLFFSGANSENPNDTELWKSDGTPEGTVRVKDINPGSNASNPSHLTAIGSTVYFAANDGNGNKLWKSDGTDSGTVVAEDDNSRTFADPKGFAVIDSTLYFTTYDEDNLGELWKTDGSSSGTALIKAGIAGSPNSPRPTNELKAVGSELYFANYTDELGLELWKHDSESGNTGIVKDIAPGESYGIKNGSYPGRFTANGSTLYFVAENSTYAGELWKSDGTEAGTILVKDIRPGSAHSNMSNLTSIGSDIYFTADDGLKGTELWKSDGTEAGTILVKDIRPGSLSSSPNSLAAFGSTLYFRANDGSNGFELWTSDGTPKDTNLLKYIRLGSSS